MECLAGGMDRTCPAIVGRGVDGSLVQSACLDPGTAPDGVVVVGGVVRITDGDAFDAEGIARVVVVVVRP